MIVGQWREQRPDLDSSAKHVTGRVVRLASLFQRAYGEEFRGAGLGEGSYGVLVALRRAGAPYTLTPTALARQRMMSSGGMTLVVDGLERRGLVERLPNPADRRGNLVRLTDDGTTTVEAAMDLHAATEQRLLAGLGDRDREQLAELLRKLLLSIDEPVAEAVA